MPGLGSKRLSRWIESRCWFEWSRCLLAGSMWNPHVEIAHAGVSRQSWRKDCVSSSAGSASKVLESRSLVR